jgi:spore maturation protein CgeB
MKLSTKKRILVILPKSIAGGLIMESLASGFEAAKCSVLVKEIDEVEDDDLKYFKPDIILGYDYSFLADENCHKIISKYKCKNLVFYFADEPKSKFALGENKYYYDELSKMNADVFVWDRDFLQEFPKTSGVKCHFLPLAISPIRYAVDFSGYNYDITFVGRPLTDIRQEILCALIKVYREKVSIFSYERHFRRSVDEIKEKHLLTEEELDIYKNSWKGFIKKEEDLAKIYNSSKININITEQGKSSLNYRVFEVLASGGFLLTDKREDNSKFFDETRHFEEYENAEDLIDKIDFYMKNLNIAQRFAQLGRLECYEKHNYVLRAKTILKNLYY